MTILIIVAAIVLLPFILKILLIYGMYCKWALQLLPLKVTNLKQAAITATTKKNPIGFPTNIPNQVPVAEKKKENDKTK
jgi:hypothetical protein